MLYETAGNREEMKPSFLPIVSVKLQLSTEEILQPAQWAVADIKGNFMSVNRVPIIVIIHVSNIIANQVHWSANTSASSSQEQEKQKGQSDLLCSEKVRENLKSPRVAHVSHLMQITPKSTLTKLNPCSDSRLTWTISLQWLS